MPRSCLSSTLQTLVETAWLFDLPLPFCRVCLQPVRSLLTSDPQHQRAIFLHTAATHCTFFRFGLNLCVNPVWRLWCCENPSRSAAGWVRHSDQHVQIHFSRLSPPVWCSLWTPASCHLIGCLAFCVNKQLNNIPIKVGGEHILMKEQNV